MQAELTPPTFARDSAGSGVWQQQLKLLLDSTGEGVFGIDLHGECVFINRAGAAMLGWDADAVLGQNMHQLTHHSHEDGTHYPDTQCPIFNAFRRGLACRIETEVFWRKDHSAFAVEYSSHPILDGDTVLGAVITFVDITARRQAALALQHANARLERSNDELESRVAERTRELSAALGQLRQLSAYSETIREEERTRIAREVHDELGSMLVALKMDVNWMDKRLSEQKQRTPPEAESMRTRLRCKCQNMSQQIESAVVNVGRIITDLRPSILDHQGLWAALEWQAHDFTQSAELELDWQMEGTEHTELSEPVAMAVFRIFQEMLSNVGRHARASQIQVRIHTNATELSLLVRDNGRGASADAFDAPTAYGVMGMRERARHHGGRLAITSQLGQGSLFHLRMPIVGP
ncbi:histidine kinase [Rhodoferax lacus]|uniref:Oxygen sensor histidine kinase NreB n=1 Tax=Rhodoferax lacus TaxID=2184758 RepID=A0A3E1RB02_9BURK|nr:PAS domain S-box protein [Rhodoferax lacus]RFO96527.1 histidine kinase [Rhodoferax lacus]